MVELSRSQATEAPKPKSNPWVIVRDDSGQLVGTPSKDPSSINNPGSYVFAAFSRSADSENDRKDRFYRLYNRLDCFHCADGGTHILDVETPRGTYPIGFACNCNAGDKYARSTARIDQAVSSGAYQLACKLAGDCDLTQKNPKCYRHVCPRFGGSQ